MEYMKNSKISIKEQLELLKELEEIAENCLETGVPYGDWTGEKTLGVSKIRKYFEKIAGRKTKPRKFADAKDRDRHTNNKRLGKTCDCSYCEKPENS